MSIRAIVTGQSRGLGEAIAGEMLRNGIKVLGLSRKTSATLADEFGKAVDQREIDLADAHEVARFASSAELADFLAGASKAYLVNNAGMVQPIGPVGSQGAQAIAAAVSLNVTAPLVLADAFVAASHGVPDRRIMHISSGAARNAYAGWGIYCATKAALDHHARCVVEDACENLRITSLAPGVIDTDMQADIRGSSETAFPMIDRFKAMKAEGALATPKEVASKIVAHLGDDGFGREVTTDLRSL